MTWTAATVSVISTCCLVPLLLKAVLFRKRSFSKESGLSERSLRGTDLCCGCDGPRKEDGLLPLTALERGCRSDCL